MKFFGQTGIREFLWIHACTVPVKRVNLIPVILNSVKTIFGSKGYAGSQSPDYCNLKLANGFLIYTMVNGWDRSSIQFISQTVSTWRRAGWFKYDSILPNRQFACMSTENYILLIFDSQEFNFGTIPVQFQWIRVCPKKMYRGFAYKPFSYLNFFTRMTKCCIYRNPMHPIEFPLNPSHM